MNAAVPPETHGSHLGLDDGSKIHPHSVDTFRGVNATFVEDSASHSDALTVYAVLLLVSSTLLHTMLIAALVSAKCSRPSQVLICWLTVSDLCVTLVYLPCVLLLLMTSMDLDCRSLCIALSALERGLIAACVWSTTLFSFDRYLYIVHYSRYQKVMTSRTASLASICVWMLGIVFGAVSSIVSAHSTDSKGHCLCHPAMDFYGIYHLLYSAAFITLCFVLPTTLLFVFYGFIARVAFQRAACKHKNPFRLQTPVLASHRGESSSLSDVLRLRTTRVLLMLLTLYLCCVTPYFILNIAISTGSWSFAFPQTPYLLAILLLHTHTTLNPLLYGFSNRRLCAAFTILLPDRHLLCRILLERGSDPDLMEDSWSEEPCALEGPEGIVPASASRDSFLLAEDVVGDEDGEECHALTAGSDYTRPTPTWSHVAAHPANGHADRVEGPSSSVPMDSHLCLTGESKQDFHGICRMYGRLPHNSRNSLTGGRLANPRVQAVAKEVARNNIAKQGLHSNVDGFNKGTMHSRHIS